MKQYLVKAKLKNVLIQRVLARKGNFRLKKVIFVQIWQNLANCEKLQRLIIEAHYKIMREEW